jgi:hypothetical protein
MKKKKPVVTRKARATRRLQNEIARWVETFGGKALVIGGVQIMRFPDDLKFNYTIAIRCTGRVPVASPAQNSGDAK